MEYYCYSNGLYYGLVFHSGGLEDLHFHDGMATSVILLMAVFPWLGGARENGGLFIREKANGWICVKSFLIILF